MAPHGRWPIRISAHGRAAHGSSAHREVSRSNACGHGFSRCCARAAPDVAHALRGEKTAGYGAHENPRFAQLQPTPWRRWRWAMRWGLPMSRHVPGARSLSRACRIALLGWRTSTACTTSTIPRAPTWVRPSRAVAGMPGTRWCHDCGRRRQGAGTLHAAGAMHFRGKVRHAVLIGKGRASTRSRHSIGRCLQQRKRGDSMAAAVKRGPAAARRAGDTVLLSPGLRQSWTCSSDYGTARRCVRRRGAIRFRRRHGT